MCGRFTLRTPMNQLAQQFLFELEGELPEPRYNIAPSQPVAAIRKRTLDSSPQLSLLRWGLVPSWAKDAAIGNKLINARGETVAEKPSFRSAFEHRRCLILSDGYYEWQKVGSSKRKQPHYIHMRDEKPFAFAGLWESWQASPAVLLETCTIITTSANDLTSSIHPRMPVILDAVDYDPWLSAPNPETADLKHCLRPYPSEQMVVYPVSTLVNSPKNESPNCIVPLDASDSAPTGPQQLDLL